MRRVAIVSGVRTPFAKAGTVFTSMSAIDLGRVCVSELVQRANLDPASVERHHFRHGDSLGAGS